MNHKVACCYLTHEHPEVMEEVLGKIYEPYGEKGIDVYIYDSSRSDDTKRVVDKYISRGVCTIHHVPMKHLSDEKGGDAKYLEVTRGYGLVGEYDYIWPTKDRCWFEGQTLDEICDAIDEGHDIVFAVDERDRYEIIKRPTKSLYTDPVEFFADYGALLTNWECLVRRKDTMLDPIDWDLYAKEHNVCKDNNFNQTVTTLVRLSEMNSCSIKVIESGLDDKRYSDKAGPLWLSSILDIWIDRFIPAIFELPTIYDPYKMSVIKTQLGHVSLFGSNDALIFLRNTGTLTAKRAEQLRSIWNMISRLPISNLERILANDEDVLISELYDEYKKSFEENDHEKGYYLFIQNGRFGSMIPKDDYRILALSYYVYMKDMMRAGYSLLFKGVTCMEDLITKFRRLSES